MTKTGKTLKKLLSLALCMLMVFGSIAIGGNGIAELFDNFAVKASATVTNGKCGDNLTWSFDDSAGILIISGTGAMYDFSYEDIPWRSYEMRQITIVIEDGVTSIGDNAFNFDGGAIALFLPKSIQSVSEKAFCDYFHVNNVVYAGDDSESSSLKNSEIMQWATWIYDSSLCKDGDRLYFISKDEATLYSWNKTASGSVTIPSSFNGKPVTQIFDYAFYDCSGITDVTIPLTIKSIGNSAFQECTSLTSVNIPSSVTYLGQGVFFDCSSLSCTIRIPDGFTTINFGMFYGCSKLKTIIIPETITQYCYTAFYGSGLTDVYFEGCEADRSGISIDEDYSYYKNNNLFVKATWHYDINTTCEHVWESEYTTDKIATATEHGSKHAFCKYCYSIHTEVIHNFEYETSGNGSHREVCTVAGCEESKTVNCSGGTATCTARAHCEFCNAEYGEFLSHNYGEWITVKEATCSESGVRYEQCKVCGIVETEIINKKSHNYGEWVTVKDSTCTDKGFEYRTCTECGFIETNGIDATEHSWDADYTVDKAATCTEAGTESIHCSKCSATKDSRTINATGHTMGEWNTVKNAKDVEVYRQCKCTACQYTETELIDNGTQTVLTVTGSHYNENGELILELSDGTTYNAGVPAGQQSEQEEPQEQDDDTEKLSFFRKIINFFKKFIEKIKNIF